MIYKNNENQIERARSLLGVAGTSVSLEVFTVVIYTIHNNDRII